MRKIYRQLAGVVLGVSGVLLVSCGGGDGVEVSENSTMERLEAAGFSFSIDEYHRAAREGETETVTLFHEAGMEIEAAVPNGMTALFVAADNGQTEVVSALLEKGADANVQLPGGNTPLLAAAANGHSGTAKVLLEAGADPEARDGHNWTPLTRAAFEGFSETVKVIAPKSRSELDAALHLASVNGNPETIDALLNAGASVFARSNENKTALMYAAANGKTDIVRVLLQNGSNRFAIDGDGKTSAQLAGIEGHVAVADFLLEPPTEEERSMPENPAFADLTPVRDEFTPARDEFVVGDVGDIAPVTKVKNRSETAPVSLMRQPVPKRIDGGVVAAPVAVPNPTKIADGGNADEGAFGEGDLNEPDPVVDRGAGHAGARGPAAVTVKMPREKVAAVAGALKMHDYRESQLPVMLDDVVGETATVRVLYGEVDAVEVKPGEQIGETGLEVVEVRRRFITSKQGKGDAVNVSEMEIRDMKSGERTLVVKDVPAKANDTYALMSIDGSGDLYDVRRDDQFAAEVPELGQVRFRVVDVRPTQVVLEDTGTSESFTIPRTTYGL